MKKSKLHFLEQLETIVQDRIRTPKVESYTAQLVAAGRQRLAQKLGEEGVELALAAVMNDRNATLNEAADLVYHLLVLLNEQGISLADVSRRLEERHNKS